MTNGEPLAPEVKSLESALAIRSRILGAFEAAEVEPDPNARERPVTFVVVGAGPTGVEMAGQIAELARDTLRRDFRAIDPREARVLLVEAAGPRAHGVPAVALGEPPRSLRAARRDAADRPHRDRHRPDAVDRERAAARRSASRRARSSGLPASTPPSSRPLGEQSGAEVDRAGRVTVEPDLTLPGHPEVVALGDMVRVRPRTATCSCSGRGAGCDAAGSLRRPARARPPTWADDRAVPLPRQGQPGDDRPRPRGRRPARLRLSGFVAWATWLVVHLWYLVGFHNRLLVFMRWAFSFTTHGRGARLITSVDEEPAAATTSPKEAETCH